MIYGIDVSAACITRTYQVWHFKLGQCTQKLQRAFSIRTYYYATRAECVGAEFSVDLIGLSDCAFMRKFN